MSMATLCYSSEGNNFCPLYSNEYGCAYSYTILCNQDKRYKSILPETWHQFSKNCKLVCVVTEEETFIPKREFFGFPEDRDE